MILHQAVLLTTLLCNVYLAMPNKPSVQVGEKYGTRTVISLLPKRAGNHALRYLVRCDCGTQSEVYGFTLKRGVGCNRCSVKKAFVESKTYKCGKTRTYSQGCKCSLCREANAKTMARYRKTEKGKQVVRNWNLKKYGITGQEYDEMLAAQNGVCAICEKPETKTNQYGIIRLAVDHCHSTGKNRGLLCMNCNRSLGLISESVKTLESMIGYIKRHEK